MGENFRAVDMTPVVYRWRLQTSLCDLVAGRFDAAIRHCIPIEISGPANLTSLDPNANVFANSNVL
tara:strand:- start:516 stop:713 length:198 start_codon:yes stop_codon:yes gene_type:complete